MITITREETWAALCHTLGMREFDTIYFKRGWLCPTITRRTNTICTSITKHTHKYEELAKFLGLKSREAARQRDIKACIKAKAHLQCEKGIHEKDLKNNYCRNCYKALKHAI